jgi:hypothetical protein
MSDRKIAIPAGMKIAIPAGMLEAFHKAEYHFGLKWDDATLDKMLDAAIRWLVENPIVPTQDQRKELLSLCNEVCRTLQKDYEADEVSAVNAAIEWQRIMFLATEPKETEAQFVSRWFKENSQSCLGASSVYMDVNASQRLIDALEAFASR